MDNMTKDYKESLIAMRRHLHQYPETAHQEEKTAQYLLDFLGQFNPDNLISGIGGHGIAAIYNGKNKGPAVLIRCELDGLPIKEDSRLEHRSVYENKGHLCGHDGHMTMVAGLAPLLSVSRPQSGSVILLFQPAEETGEGADRVLSDEKFGHIQPDYVFALHNLPGFPESAVITRNGVFASASKGLIIELEGASSHAGHPEGGNNPAVAAAQLVQSMLTIPQKHLSMHDAALITPIHMRVGQPAFGTSPGDGVVMFTIRAHSNASLETMEKEILHQVKHIARAHNLSYRFRWIEPFEAVVNDPGCVEVIEKCAADLELEVIHKEIPFPWSEDFGVFTNKYKGALFGMGAGEKTPQLHNENYDFPDQLLEKGTMMFYRIIDALLNTDSKK
ncbi:MAG: amidohydrolase [Bacteroidales bacterium]|nr:amidohydrolase [Bacteroidales bacterium]MDT8432146.1 amidohydrolase [Bacteroidales bacterium]